MVGGPLCGPLLAGQVVKTIKPIATLDKLPITFPIGSTGVVMNLDDDGDGNILFPHLRDSNSKIECRRWIASSSFASLVVAGIEVDNSAKES